MNEFIDAVRNHTFMQYALLAGLLSAIACGVVGSYVVVKRISYIVGGISHCVLGGIGAANYFRKVYGLEFLNPLYGAVAAALIAAIVIGVVSIRAKQKEDTVIGALWAVGMATGVLFISRTPGYNEDLMNYLFGNILMVSPADLKLIAFLDVAAVSVGAIFYNQFLAVCFDEEFARLRGLNVEFYYLFLLCLTALTVVLLISVVGVVLVIALLTLPAAVSTFFSNRLWKIMLLSTFFSLIFTFTGLALSYPHDLPAGATIILISAAFYLLCSLFKNRISKLRSA